MVDFRESWLELLKRQRAIAVIRSPDFQAGLAMAKAVAKGGMRIIEITWNSEQPAQLITQLRQELPNCTIGAGTILNQNHLGNAIASGAEFIFSPHLDLQLIETCIAQEIPTIPGTLSPTEIVTAFHGGATCVKVFPIQAVGGCNYIKNLQAPLGHIPLIPTGGITLTNAHGFIQAGAIAVGLSSQLFPLHLVKAQDWQQITKLASHLLESLVIRATNEKSTPRFPI